MSFYGNTFYEFVKLFHRMYFKNSGKEVEQAKDNYADNTITAEEKWDILNFDTGNKWIVLEGQDDGVIISHGKPGVAVVENYGFNPTDDNDAEMLQTGQSFDTYKFLFDDAGHLTSSKKFSYKLPNSEVMIDETIVVVPHADDDRLHFNSDNWIKLNPNDNKDVITFNHHTPFEENGNFLSFEKIIAPEEEIAEDKILKAGEYFSTPKITFDKAGHITGVENLIYKLPIEDIQGDIESIDERLTTAEENIKTNTENFKNYAPYSFTGKLANLYRPTTSNVIISQSPLNTLTKVIGNIEDYSDAIFEATGTASHSISDALIQLHTESDELKDRATTFDNAIKGLDSKIQIIADYLDIDM